MRIFKRSIDLQRWLNATRLSGHRIGFVPTMGALHAGHLSLVAAARSANEVVVCSIFVNPTQFNDPADFAKYPVTTDRDIALLTAAGCQVLFLPAADQVYPAGDLPLPHYELGYLESILEGAHRPGHFQGVCQVLHQFLKIFRPDNFYLGQKDFQQCMVVKRLLEILGLSETVTLHIGPTLREADGLAMSSRNTRLTPEQRIEATAIYRALTGIRTGLPRELPGILEQDATRQLESAGFRVDYVSVADAVTLRPPATGSPVQKLVALAAAFKGEVRLIDNLLLN